MALPSTMHRFTIELADIDRGVYETLDFRVPRHPSELPGRLVTRVLAMGLLWEPGLEFGTGLSTVQEPALWVREPNGAIALWVDVGAPAASRLHRASKHAARVAVVSAKPPPLLRAAWEGERVHRADEIEVWLVPEALQAPLAEGLGRRQTWGMTHHEGVLTVAVDDTTVSAEIPRLNLRQV